LAGTRRGLEGQRIHGFNQFLWIDRTDRADWIGPGDRAWMTPGGRVGSSENLILSLPTDLSGAEVVARLEALSKKGKLAGFERDGTAASFAAHGTPFDGRVEVAVADGHAAFSLRMGRKAPTIFAVALLVSIWPGLPITDGFLQSMLWYERLTAGWFDTWMWYIPLCALPAPLAFRSALRKSRDSATKHARETTDRLRPVLNAPGASAG
jgi:hypothetical protein